MVLSRDKPNFSTVQELLILQLTQLECRLCSSKCCPASMMLPPGCRRPMVSENWSENHSYLRGLVDYKNMTIGGL